MDGQGNVIVFVFKTGSLRLSINILKNSITRSVDIIKSKIDADSTYYKVLIFLLSFFEVRSSTKVFHWPQEGHFPNHLEDDVPQFWQ